MTASKEIKNIDIDLRLSVIKEQQAQCVVNALDKLLKQTTLWQEICYGWNKIERTMRLFE
jgi:hypothetical protein